MSNFLKPIEIVNPDYDEYLSIQYSLTNVCNYGCNYCWPDCHSGTSRWPDYDIICKNFDHLLSVYKNHFNKKKIRFHLIGGEPTLWPRLGDFSKFIYEKHGCRMTMSTNGSRTVRWFDEYAEYFNDIQVSVHHEFCDVQHIKEVLDCIYSKGTVMTAASVLMDPLSWDKCLSIINELVNHPVDWMVKQKLVVEPTGTDMSKLNKNYTREQLEYLKDKIKKLPPAEYISKMKELDNIEQNKTSAIVKFRHGMTMPYDIFSLNIQRSYSFVGWECNLGKDRVNIRADGRLLGGCGELKIYGREPFYISDQNFIERFTPDVVQTVTCSIPICGDSTDIKLSKRKMHVD